MSRIEELTEELISITGYNNSKHAERIFEVLKNEHRTHQASFIRTISQLLKLYAEESGDLRNRAAIDYAKNATEANSENPIPHI